MVANDSHIGRSISISRRTLQEFCAVTGLDFIEQNTMAQVHVYESSAL